MKTRTFSFEVPEELIAQTPAEKRGTSRLMLVDRASGNISHHSVEDLPGLLPRDSLMVLNDSRVRKARLYGLTPDGGRVQFLLLSHNSDGSWQCLVSKAKKQKTGREYVFPGGVKGRIAAEEGEFRTVLFSSPLDEGYLDRWGHMPLPPYIKRNDTDLDSERYQTIYAAQTGSVAAPTAGLHFTEKIFTNLREKGIEISRVTLHVGIGTFLPIRSEDIEEHRMHREEYFISKEAAKAVTRAKKSGRPVCAVGTTSVRTLESAWRGDELAAGEASTELYIYPGYHFRVVDMLFTNFHTPKSSLLVMVSAFAGKELIEEAYAAAVRERYRFFSYGDAMLIR
jgi:S-adenosylmethionine:tRNA ribosyltransferase-isomerase